MWLTLEQTADATSTSAPTWRTNTGIDFTDFEANVQAQLAPIPRHSTQNNSHRLSASSSCNPSLQSPITKSPLSNNSSSLSLAPEPSSSNGQASLSLPLSKHASSSNPPPSPRARFAENPIIGPTRGPSPQLQRRKSALKSSSPLPKENLSSSTVNEIQNDLEAPNPYMIDERVNFATPDQKHRQRTYSVASADLNSPGHRQRTHSMSDLSPRVISPDSDMEAAEAYEQNRIKTLATSNPSILAGFVMGKDEIFREKARKNMGLLSTSEVRDDQSSSSVAGDLQKFQSQRPPSPSLSASSSLSSSSFDLSSALSSSGRTDTDQSTRPKFIVRPLKLRPHVLPPSLAPEPPETRETFTVTHVRNSRLEIQNPLVEARPNTGGRKRSGTLVAPKKVKSISSASVEASSSTTRIPPLPPVPHLDQPPVPPVPPVPDLDHLQAPPPRPPRSTRRNNQRLEVDSATSKPPAGSPSRNRQIVGHDKENVAPEILREEQPLRIPEQSTQSTRPSTAMATNPNRVSGKPVNQNGHRSTSSSPSLTNALTSSDSNSTLGKGAAQASSADTWPTSSISSQVTLIPASSQSYAAPAPPSTQNCLSSPTADISAQPQSRAYVDGGNLSTSSANLRSNDRKPSATQFHEPSALSSGTDDDDFQSADEGDEFFWHDPRKSEREKSRSDAHHFVSPEQEWTNVHHSIDSRAGETRPPLSFDSTNEHRGISATTSSNSLQSPFDHSFGSSSGYHSQSSRDIWEPPFRRTAHNIIGAFPRSESMLSSSYSIAAMCQDSQPHDPLQDSLSSMAERSDRLLNDLVSAQRPSTLQDAQACSSPSSQPILDSQSAPCNLSPADVSSRMFESPQAGIGLNERLLTPYSAERGYSRPASFINADISRASSIEGLAALRNGNSPKITTNLKKSNSRSSHFRQLSNILTMRSRESSANGEPSSPRPVITRMSPKQVHSNAHVSPVSVGSGAAQSRAMLLPQTWRAATPTDEYEALLNEYGPMEMRRQEVIWELCETEITFVDGMRRVIDIFASPLRTPHGTWIDGVPTTVAKLLDWLEDVVNLHAEMVAMVERYRLRQTHTDGLVLRIADAFLKFVPRLEVHQPYLVRFSAVTASIEDMTCDIESDFGEFVRMQTSLPECGNMNLPSFLLKPVQRLMKYPLFYKQLCDLTPSNHPDHASTVNLLQESDAMIRVLQEVKGREDEYENLKMLETRIKGFPLGFRLAQRDRRLLAQGILRRVQIPSRELAEFESDSTNTREGHARPRTSVSFASPSISHRYSTAFQQPRPVSHYSDQSESSQNSIQSKSSTPSISDRSPAIMWAINSGPSSDEFAPPLTPSSTEFLPEFTSKKAPSPMPPGSLFNFSGISDSAYHGHIEHSPGTKTRQRAITSNLLMKRTKESPVHVFVFSDLIILATRHNDGVRLIKSSRLPLKKKEQTTHYCALEGVGISKALMVDDISGELGYEHLIKVDVLPIVAKSQAESPKDLDSSTAVFLTFPDRLPGSRYPASREVVQRERFKWLAAFDQSLRSPLTKPRFDNYRHEHKDRIIEMGRSPSDPGLWNAPMEEQEREERNWWMARHRAVKREMEMEAASKDHQEELVRVRNRRSMSYRTGPPKVLSRASSIIGESRRRLSIHTSSKDHQMAKPLLESSGLGLTLNFL
ncbi:hypothetical protein CROQUDRAFT_673358 [Cronartium quercuum f. sp. fusiforme G11]|uniref:DH domain-containing protein n=1 Tax=Cronartium quercuum f. sp. fusiforme G11 TaxID=708437 RepID=A0A9P6NBX7_9BASI|nr:hypothetical protein CROQUDRAFT_673358 [Cronartium quercuum f. sp. fusiforme G11]